MPLNGQPQAGFRGICHDVTEEIAAIGVLNVAFETALSRRDRQTEGFDAIFYVHGENVVPFHGIQLVSVQKSAQLAIDGWARTNGAQCTHSTYTSP